MNRNKVLEKEDGGGWVGKEIRLFWGIYNSRAHILTQMDCDTRNILYIKHKKHMSRSSFIIFSQSLSHTHTQPRRHTIHLLRYELHVLL